MNAPHVELLHDFASNFRILPDPRLVSQLEDPEPQRPQKTGKPVRPGRVGERQSISLLDIQRKQKPLLVQWENEVRDRKLQARKGGADHKYDLQSVLGKIA